MAGRKVVVTVDTETESPAGEQKMDSIGGPTNDASDIIAMGQPYVARIVCKGTAPMLLHGWSVEAVAEKQGLIKGSEGKKTDNVESYVSRCEDGTIGIPGTYLMATISSKNGAAKYRQDPRSPRKSALDLYKSGLVVMTHMASLGAKEWDYLDRRRVTVQMSGITRTRPAFHMGWQCEFEIMVLLPEYIREQDLLSVLTDAGRFCGFGDYRPTFGRFQVTKFETSKP